MKRMLALVLAVCMCMSCGLVSFASGWELLYDRGTADSGAPPDGGTYDSGVEITVAGKGSLSKGGHTFGGWKDSGENRVYQPGETLVMPERDVTLVAIWNEEGSGTVDKTSLESALADISAKVDNIGISEDGSDIPNDIKWITPAVEQEVRGYFDDAQAICQDPDATQEEVSAAIDMLKEARKLLDDAQFGTGGETATSEDIAKLQNAVGAAEGNLASVVMSEDGANVPTTQQWVPPYPYNKYLEAINQANELLGFNWIAKEDAEYCITILEDMGKAFDAAKQPGKKPGESTVDMSKLEAELQKAYNNYADTSDDGADITVDEFWTTLDAANLYYEAVSAANDVRWNTTGAVTQAQVDKALADLQAATKAYNTEKKPGTAKTLKEALSVRIEKARDMTKGVVISENGLDVGLDTLWVTQEIMDEFMAAIEEAQKVLDDPKSGETDFRYARDHMRGSMEHFDYEMQYGKTETDLKIDAAVDKILDYSVDPSTPEGKKVINESVEALLETDNSDLLKNESYLENIEEIADRYAQANGIEPAGSAQVTEVPDGMEKSDLERITVLGDALSGSKDQKMILTVSKPEAPVSEGALNRELSNQVVAKQVQLDISLNVNELKAPIALRLLVPNGIDLDKLVIFHEHGSSVQVVPFKVLYGRLIEITVPNLSTFVLAEVEAKPNDSHDDSDDGSSGGGGGGGSSTTSTASTASGASALQPATQAVVTTATAKAVAAAKAAGSNTAVVGLQNVSTISPAILRSIAADAAAAGLKTTVHADTMAGGVVAGRLYLDPAKNTLATDLNLGVTVGDAAVKALFEKHFSNTVEVVKFGQKGSFGMEVQAAVKLDLTGLNTQTLCFYTYDSATNRYRQVVNPRYFIDANGYLHLFLSEGNTLLVTDRPLTAK